MNAGLPAFDRVHLERLKLAADILLSETDTISDPLETELTLYRERIQHALLLPGHGGGEASA